MARRGTIHRALLAGDKETGVTIMRVVKALDAGPMMLEESTPIGPEDTAADLHDRLAEIGARADRRCAGRAAGRNPRRDPATGPGRHLCRQAGQNEGRMDWSETAEVLARRVRGYNPWPGAWCEHDGTRIKVLAAEAIDGTGTPGQLLDENLTVACGRGALRLTRVQRPGQGTDGGDGFPARLSVGGGRQN